MSSVTPGAEGQRPNVGPRGGAGREPLSAGAYAGLGLQFAAAILFFLFLGTWLDKKMHTSPVFLMLGVFLGAGGAFYSIYRRLMAAQRGERRERGASGPP